VDYSDVQKLITEQKLVWGKAHRQMIASQNMYDLKYDSHAIRIPRGVVVHTPSTAASIVDASRSQLRTDDPRVKVEADGSSQDARSLASKLRLGAQMLLKRMLGGVDQPLLSQVLFDFMRLGMGVAKTVYDIDMVPEAPQRSEFKTKRDFDHAYKAWDTLRTNVHPFFDAVLDPHSVFTPKDETWPYSWAVEVQERTYASIREQYDKWIPPKRNEKLDPSSKVEYIEYWTKNTVQRWADGVSLYDGPNPRGVVPYVRGYSGLGGTHLGGDPADAVIGILTKVESELQAEVRLKTAMDALWQYHVWPRLLTQEDPNTLKKSLQMGAGGIIQWHGPRDAKPEFLAPPAINASMITFLPELKDSITKATLQDVLQGERPRGVDYGYLQALLISQAALRFAAPKISLELFASRMVRLKYMQLAAVDHPISVHGYDEDIEGTRMLSARDMSGHVEVDVEFGTGDPLDDNALVTTTITALQAGLIDMRTAIERLGKDPDEIMAEILAWDTVKLAVAQGVFLPDYMKRLLAEQQADGAEAAVQSTQGAVQSLLNPGAREGVPRQKGLAVGAPGERAPQPRGSEVI
jgi:hypothetical protein